MKTINNHSENLKNFDLEAFAGMNSHSEKVIPDSDIYKIPDSDIYKEVKDIANQIAARQIDITSGYENWLRLGFALANGLGEEGREIFHQLSQLNGDYTPKECDKKYDSCIKGSGSGITISTFFHMAKDAGIDIKRPSSATSAIPPTTNHSKKTENNTVLGGLGNGMADGGMADVAETTPLAPDNSSSKMGTVYTFSDKTKPEDWPSFLSPIFETHHDTTGRDKMILASLNVVSGLLGGTNGNANIDQRSGVYGIYDNKRVYAPLFNIVYGNAGSAKGDMAYCKMLARPVKLEMRRQYEKEKEEYEAEMVSYEAQNKGKKKGERGTPPKEPAYRDPFMPGNSSSSAIYRGLDANGGWGMIYETEADTVSSMIDSDYGNYSDLLRKVFHHETISMSRVSEKLHIDIENPRLSTFITCTPGQLLGLFPSFENGLGSRFLFYNLPDDKVVFHDVFASCDTTLEDVYKQMGEELLPLYHSLQGRVGHPIQFVLSATQQKEFLTTYSDILTEQFNMLGTGITAFIFRTALSCFRYAMVLSTLRKLSDWDKQDDIFSEDENALVCDERDFHIAMNIVGSLIYHTARVYSVLAKENENPFAQKGIKLSHEEMIVYQALPIGEFRTKDFIYVAANLNVPTRTAERMLGKMSNQYCIITPIKKGVYCKHTSPS